MTTRLAIHAAKALAGLAVLALGQAALAKLPALSDEQKAKAAEAAARAAWTGKVADFKLCKVQNEVVAGYVAETKAAGKAVPIGQAGSACVDPGPFAYTPPEPKPLEAAGAHSPPDTAKGPPNTTVPAAEAPKKP